MVYHNLGIFGCYRAGELVHMPSKLGYIPPLVQDLTFGYVNGKLFLQLLIKRSKARTATLGYSIHSLCTVCITAKYL